MLIENPFCNPSNAQKDEEDRQEAMSVKIALIIARKEIM